MSNLNFLNEIIKRNSNDPLRLETNPCEDLFSLIYLGTKKDIQYVSPRNNPYRYNDMSAAFLNISALKKLCAETLNRRNIAGHPVNDHRVRIITMLLSSL